MDFSISPYYDDFENKARIANYMRILFKPGYAVQARELTQAQSILQNQIKEFGDHIFQNGSPVHGGHLTFDSSVKAIQVQPTQGGVPITLTDFAGTLIVNNSGSSIKRARVIAVDDSLESNTSGGAILCKYLTGLSFDDGETVRIATGTQETATLLSSNATSNGSVVSINEGIFYVDGYFVYVAPQTIVLDALSITPSYRIGLQIDDGFINSSTDDSLLDPAQQSFNYQAPGADRYQFNLTLTKRALNSTDDSQFFELLRVENGIITKQVDYPIYSDLESTLARRTYDQSGDFTVSPFRITCSDNLTDNTKFNIDVEPGKAYVKGFEFETIGTVLISNDKARTTNTSTAYDLNLEYGNYLVVANVFSGNNGIFNTGSFAQMDMHCVQTASINTASAAAYANTLIGTARIRNLEFAGGGNYYAYILDVSTIPNAENAVALSVNTTSIRCPASFSDVSNAYSNVQVSVLAGNSSGDVRVITSYDGATRTAFVSVPFTQQIDTNSLVSFDYGTKDIDSLVVTPAAFTSANVFGAKNATSAIYPCMDVSSVGREITSGNTKVYLTEFNRMIHSLPETFLAQNSFTNMSYISRKLLTNQTFDSTGNLIIGTGTGLDTSESFTYGYASQYIPDNTANNNVFVVVRDKQSSNLANGQIIAFNKNAIAGGNGVYQTDSTHLTIDVSTTSGFIGDVLITVKENSSEVNNRRLKTIVGNTQNTVLRTTDKYTNGTAVLGTGNASSVFVDTANGFVWFTNWNDIVKTSGTKQSLYIPDVTSIIKIYDSGSPTLAPNVSNTLTDITSNFLFDSGQKDNYYDHASIILRDGANPPTGQTVVMLSYYNHSATTGFFNADSYPAADYSTGNIPYYSSLNFGTFSLRDSIDFRPTRSIGTAASVATFTLAGLKIAQPDNPMELTYGYYLPRIDKLALTRDKQFKIIKGVPEAYPKTPKDSDDAMTLYVLSIPPYSAKVSDIQIQYVENRRYTMRDIGALDNRITQLEYYTALSQLETQTTDQSVLYQDGATAKDKYGIIADNFDGFNIADNKSPDLICNLGDKTLTPYHDATPLEFFLDSATGSYGHNSKTLSVAYSETPCVVQNTATKAITVQPYAFASFIGDVKLTPETDYWYSATLDPVVITPPTDFVRVETPPTGGGAIKTPPPSVDMSVNTAVTKVVTTTNPTTPNKVVGGDATPVTVPPIKYCVPVWFGFGVGSFGGVYLTDHGDTIYWNGSTPYNTLLTNGQQVGGCTILPKTATGFGSVTPTQWFGAAAASTPTKTEAVVSQTKVAPPINTGAGINLAAGGGFASRPTLKQL